MRVLWTKRQRLTFKRFKKSDQRVVNRGPGAVTAWLLNHVKRMTAAYFVDKYGDPGCSCSVCSNLARLKSEHEAILKEVTRP